MDIISTTVHIRRMHASNHAKAIPKIPGRRRSARNTLGNANPRGTRSCWRQARENTSKPYRCPAQGSSWRHRARQIRTPSRNDRSAGNFIRNCRRRRCGPTTTARGSRARPARSAWPVVAQSGTPLTVNYTHDLPSTYPSWIPVDTRLTPLGNEVRLMTHLHGGFVASDSDGNPAVTPNGFGRGETQSVFYTNQPPQMPASLLWFHDHGLSDATERLCWPRCRVHCARRE